MTDKIAIRIINLAHRQDRRQACQQEMAAQGLTDYGFFAGKYLAEAPARGCALSHGKLIADFLFEDERPFLLVLEDDFALREGVRLMPGLEAAIGQAQLWDVFLLAHNAAIPIARTPLADAYRVVNAQTACAYLVGRLYAGKLMETFFRAAQMQDEVKDIPSPAREIAGGLFRCDMLWKRLQEEDRFWAQIPAPAFQRASYSDIEKKMVDYRT